MNKNEIKRKKIFEAYSEIFELFYKSKKWHITIKKNGKKEKLAERIYICPICMGPFTKDELNQEYENCLTLEDAPPKKLGGKANLLTCKKCNNDSGKNLDSHLKKKLEITQVITQEKDASFPVSYKIGNSIVKGLFGSKVNGGYELHIDNNTNPNATTDILKMIKDGPNGSFNILFKLTDELKFKIAVLRIAHLIAFQFFGYSYLFNESIQKICKQILNPEERILNKIPVSSLKLNENFIGVNFINQPKNCKAFLITFKMKLKETGYEKIISCALPGPSKIGWGYFENLNKLKQEEKFDIIHFEFPTDLLTNENCTLNYFNIWQNLNNGA